MELQDLLEQYPMQERTDTARSYLDAIGTIFPFYSSPVRAICCSRSILKTDDPEALRTFAVHSAMSPIKVSPSITESFKLAVEELYEEHVADLKLTGEVSLSDSINLLEPSEISGILAITYFFKMLRKKTDAEEFDGLAPFLSLYLGYGCEEGLGLHERFGRGGGIAAAGIRVLSFAVFMKANLKSYKKLRRQINADGNLLQTALELQFFGCSHLDIAAELAARLGFGHAARSAFMTLESGDDASLSEEGLWWYQCLRSIDSKLSKERKAGRKTAFTKDSTSPLALEALDGLRWLWKIAEEPDKEVPMVSPIQEALSKRPSRVEAKFDIAESRVLIVEDEEINQKILDKQIEHIQNRDIVASAEEALGLIAEAQASSRPFSLLLLDVSLPGMSGIELLKIIRSEEKNPENAAMPQIKVLMVTAAESPQTVVQAFNEGADGYLTKPTNKARLFKELEKIGVPT